MQWGQGCFYWDFLLHYQTAVVILEDRTNYLQELLDFFSGTEKLVIKIHLACEQLLWARHTARCFPAPVKNLIALKLQIYGHEHTCTCRCWHSKECILMLKWVMLWPRTKNLPVAQEYFKLVLPCPMLFHYEHLVACKLVSNAQHTFTYPLQQLIIAFLNAYESFNIVLFLRWSTVWRRKEYPGP